MKLFLIQLSLGLFQFDLAVKNEIEFNSKFKKEQTFLNGLVGLKKFYNYGLAGGGFASHMPTIIKVSGIMILGSIGLFLKILTLPGRWLQKLGFTFLIGGALSNFYDRCKKGYVVDYISFHTAWKKFNQLVFNLADFFIAIGMFLIVLGTGTNPKKCGMAVESKRVKR